MKNNVINLPGAGSDRTAQIEEMFAELVCINRMQLVLVDGQHYTPCRDFLARQMQTHLQALEALVLPEQP